MTDTVACQTRSRMMSQIRSTETSPERFVRSYLHRHGLRFRKNVSDLPGKPDIVLPRYSTAVFVHGCFWHQHAKCRDGRVPSSNVEYWGPKLERTQQRDRDHQAYLQEAGWRVYVIWECEINECRLHALIRQIRSVQGTSRTC